MFVREESSISVCGAVFGNSFENQNLNEERGKISGAVDYEFLKSGSVLTLSLNLLLFSLVMAEQEVFGK